MDETTTAADETATQDATITQDASATQAEETETQGKEHVITLIMNFH